MGLNKSEEIPDVFDRFMIAQDGPTKSEIAIKAEKAVQMKLREKIYEVALILTQEVDAGREQSLALTKLEEALMWGGKAIFK